MNRKKVLVGTLLTLTIISITIGVVSAGFWDIFKIERGKGEDLGGELREERFETTVTLTNAPPRIVAFRPTDDNPNNALNPGEVQPIAGTTVNAIVTFIVEDPNGPDDLPGLGGPAISEGPVSGTGNIYVTLTAPTNAPIGGGTTRSVAVGQCSATECASGTNPNCDATTVAAGDGSDYTLQKQYTCEVTMNYYDAPAPGDVNNAATPPGDLWTITAEIKDSGGATHTVSSGDVGFDGIGCSGLGDCDYMEYLTVSGIDTAGATVSWTGLSISAEDTPADGPLTLSNWGNVPIVSVDVRGQRLTGVNIGTAEMLVEAFSMGSSVGGADSGACDGPNGGGAAPFDGAELIEANLVTAPGVSVPYTATGTDTNNLYFCIWAAVDPTYLNGPIDTAYSATIAGGNNWDVQFAT